MLDKFIRQIRERVELELLLLSDSQVQRLVPGVDALSLSCGCHVVCLTL